MANVKKQFGINVKLAPSIISTVLPLYRPTFNMWHQEIKKALHTEIPKHRKPINWFLNQFKN